MGILKKIKKRFKKKPEKPDKEESLIENTKNQYLTSKVAGYTYVITVKEEVGGTLREVKEPFMAWRWKDPEDHLTYLYSEDDKKNPTFWELFPQREEELAKLDPKQIEKRLESAKKQLLKIQEDPSKVTVNPENIKYEIMKLKAQLNASKWEKCAFLEFGYEGQKKFTFKRDGSNFFPIAYNSDFDVYGIPSDIKKKNSSIALRNKDMKHSKKKSIWQEKSTWIMMASFLLFFGSLFMIFKSYTLYSENPVNEAIEQSLKTAEQCGKIAATQGMENTKLTKELQELAKTMQETQKQRPVTIIDGLIPTQLE